MAIYAADVARSRPRPNILYTKRGIYLLLQRHKVLVIVRAFSYIYVYLRSVIFTFVFLKNMQLCFDNFSISPLVAQLKLFFPWIFSVVFPVQLFPSRFVFFSLVARIFNKSQTKWGKAGKGSLSCYCKFISELGSRLRSKIVTQMTSLREFTNAIYVFGSYVSHQT